MVKADLLIEGAADKETLVLPDGPYAVPQLQINT